VQRKIGSVGFEERRDTAVLLKIYVPVVEGRNSLLETYLTWFDTAAASDEERTKKSSAGLIPLGSPAPAGLPKNLKQPLRTSWETIAGSAVKRA
jgi:hypothetical protein